MLPNSSLAEICYEMHHSFQTSPNALNFFKKYIRSDPRFHKNMYPSFYNHSGFLDRYYMKILFLLTQKYGGGGVLNAENETETKGNMQTLYGMEAETFVHPNR